MGLAVALISTALLLGINRLAGPFE